MPLGLFRLCPVSSLCTDQRLGNYLREVIREEKTSVKTAESREVNAALLFFFLTLYFFRLRGQMPKGHHSRSHIFFVLFLLFFVRV